MATVKGPDIVNCYYYAPHNHSMLAKHINEDLKHIAFMGVDIVSVCVQESQLTNWHQKRLHNVAEAIHASGMKIHAVPNRWAGLVAGWLDGFGEFTLSNPDTWSIRQDGKSRVSCTQNPKVRQHYESTLKLMLSEYDFDGVVWDEPTSLTACHCDYCCKMFGGRPDDAWQMNKMAQFLDDMSVYAKSIRPDVVVSLFAESGNLEFAKSLAKTKNMDYLGSDGHVRSEDHQMHRMKNTIFKAHSNYYPILKEAGQKTVFLLEGQRHRDEDLKNYLENLDAAFSLPMNQLMFYYSAHEMSPEYERTFNDATWKAVMDLKK